MTKVVAMDIETDDLNATCIWCICTEDVSTGEQDQFTYVDKSEAEKQRFTDYCATVDRFVFHNGIQFDVPVVNKLLGPVIPEAKVLDTLVVSRFLNYENEPLKGVKGRHSLEYWGRRLGLHKGNFKDFSDLSHEMLDYCRNDVDITVRLYKKFLPELNAPGLGTEHSIQRLCQKMHENGFDFNKDEALVCLSEVQSRMANLEARFQVDFPPKLEVVNELKDRRKKDGTSVASVLKARGSYPKTEVKDEKLLCYDWVRFKPGSPKDRIERLWEAGWEPTDKTKGHILYLRDGQDIPEKEERFRRYGWMCNETNLATLPSTAPEGAKGLAEWLTLEGRRSSLEEWIGCEARTNDGRIHGRFQHIGAWTGRMAHSAPNQANIPAMFHGEPKSVVDQVKDTYDGRLRSLFRVPSDCYLVGTDAEGIQLRVLAHLMNSEEYVEAIVSGKKEDETDIHNVNRKALGMSHITRDMAKTFIYAFLLGAGVGKIAEILKVNTREAGQAVENFTQSISGLSELKNELVPKAAAKGYFIGLDGRKVKTPSQHKTLAGMLQNGEAVVMKHSALLWTKQLDDRGIDYKLVTWPHDEWQTEVRGDKQTAETVGLVQRLSIETTGDKLKVFCPLAGSSEVGRNWGETH